MVRAKLWMASRTRILSGKRRTDPVEEKLFRALGDQTGNIFVSQVRGERGEGGAR